MSSSTDVRQTEEDQIAMVVRRVAKAAEGRVAAAAIESVVRESFISWRHATIRDFLPVLVERSVSAKLGLTSARQAG